MNKIKVGKWRNILEVYSFANNVCALLLHLINVCEYWEIISSNSHKHDTFLKE